MYPKQYNPHPKNVVDSEFGFKNSRYKIHDENGNWESSLYAYEVPLKCFIESHREISLDKNEHKTKIAGEVFTSIKKLGGNRYFYVTLTQQFKDWFRGESLQFIQQSNAELLDVFLFKVYAPVFDFWLDYKTKEEIEALFQIKI